MEFEYFNFDVGPSLKSGQQPSFVLKKLKPACTYYAVTDLSNFEFSTARNPSEGIVVPVFAVTSKLSDHGADHGSILFAMGLENATKAFSSLADTVKNMQKVQRAVYTVANTCHGITVEEDKQYRAYFGVVFEVRD